MARQSPPKIAPQTAERLLHAKRQLQQGDIAGADASLTRILAHEPGQANALHYLGLLRHQQGAHEEALRLLREADPQVRHEPVACFNFATVLVQQARYQDALGPLEQALSLRPDYDDAVLQLGVVSFKLGDLKRAAAAFRSVVEKRPGHAFALTNLAATLLQLDTVEAVPVARRAAQAAGAKDKARPLRILAKALALNGEEEAALEIYDELLATDPADVRARYARAFTLPQVYASRDEIQRWRAHYRHGLEALRADLHLDDPEAIEATADALFTVQNFSLPQQGLDDRAEQAVYGELLHRVAAARYPAFAWPLAPQPGSGRPTGSGRPRIGLVTAFFRHHSMAKTHGAWATCLDPDKLEVFAVHTGPERDAVSDDIARACEHFLHHPAAGVPLLETLRDLALDAIIYPDLGMEPGLLLPAALRGLGHPITSGLPTIDWALTSELMEPEGGEAHYTERLERLPNLSFCYSRERIEALRGRADLRHLRSRQIVYLCTQNLGKLLPEHDDLFAQILERVPDSELWFLARPASELWFLARPAAAVTARFRDRLSARLRARGIPAERVVVHDRLGPAEFLALNEAADVYLDGIGWSGCNTTFEAIAMGLPVVTLPGDLMRKRHSFAMLKMMGLTETVAAWASPKPWRQRSRTTSRSPCGSVWTRPGEARCGRARASAGLRSTMTRPRSAPWRLFC
jgi:predicted O-linked N-acetylglucosamine transferase (SPINDLY family)